MRGGGRGRGRGRAMIPPSVAAAMAGAGRVRPEVMACSNRPPFPAPDPNKPVVDVCLTKDILEASEHAKALLRNTPFYLLNSQKEGDGLQRYSDKYNSRPKSVSLTFIPSPHTLFPEELIGPATAQQSKPSFSFSSALSRLQEAESKEDKEQDVEQSENQEHSDEAVYEEDDLEDETDYNLSYFDNGENYDECTGGGDDGEPFY